MVEYDFFDLTGLPFEPEETKPRPKKVEQEIEKRIKEIDGRSGSLSQDEEKEELKRRKEFLENEKKKIFDASGKKLTPYYDELAEKKVKRVEESLSVVIKIKKKAGESLVTTGEMKIHKNKTKLSLERVTRLFKMAGFSLCEVDPLKAYPRFPTNAEMTYSHLKGLQKERDPNPNALDLTEVKDLYAFAAYLMKEPDGRDEYSKKTRKELLSIFERFDKEFSIRNDRLGKLLAKITSAGKTYVFNSNENQQAYNDFLIYKSSELVELFESLKKLSESDKRNPKIAEVFIEQIAKHFEKYEVALAIYNKEAELQEGSLYEPVRPIYFLNCQKCKTLLEFESYSKAQEIGECGNCKKTLFKDCSKCNKKVLEQLDMCSECGYVFQNQREFVKFITAAESAFRKSDFEAAYEFLSKAKLADPSEETRTNNLNKRIRAEEERYKKPLNDLRKLIAEKKIQRASQEISEIIKKFPNLNLNSQETQINAVLLKAQAAFEKGKKASPSKWADECIGILHTCVDYTPAIHYLRATPPVQCQSINVVADSHSGSIMIGWARSSEQGVTYRLVRKLGKVLPISENDGEVLCNKTTETSYQDKHVIPGNYYSYAVFLVRYDVFSKGIGKSILLLAEVTNATITQLNQKIRLTWNVPKNCIGATVRRIVDNAREVELTNSAHGSYEDGNVQYGITYTYIIYANYSGSLQSQGIKQIATLMPKIDSFQITANLMKEGYYRVGWNIKQGGMNLRVLVEEKQVKELTTNSASCEIEIPANGFYTIAALVYSGGAWLRSENSILVNTYSPCEINKKLSTLSEMSHGDGQKNTSLIEMNLKVAERVPLNVVGFYYAVRTGTAKNKWAKKEEVGKAIDIQRISLKAYTKNKGIFYSTTARGENSYYITLFTIYEVKGKEIISDPKGCRLDRPIEANIYWRVTRSILGKSTYKLSLDIESNRSISRLPVFVLCLGTEQGRIKSLQNPEVERIFETPASELEEPALRIRRDYEVKSTKQLRGEKLYFFVDEMLPSEKFIPRWAEKFEGKVR